MSTILGITFGMLILVFTFTGEGGTLKNLFMPAPLLVVIGGTFAATLAGTRWKIFWEFPSYIKQVMIAKDVDNNQLKQEIIQIAAKLRLRHQHQLRYMDEPSPSLLPKHWENLRFVMA